MDDAERIPIDLGYEVAVAAQSSDPRVTVREDGSVVMDILVPLPCGVGSPTSDEIVVCAEVPEGSQPSVPPPPSPNLNEKISDALNGHIGPLEIGSIPQRDGTYRFGARVRF